MKKVLFVCLGNICRSPLAEGILLHLKDRDQLNLHIDSAGTAGYHIGEAPDPRTIANALKNGVDLRSLRARQFKASDLDEFDHIFVMDKNNHRNVLAMAKHEHQKHKVDLLLNVSFENSNLEVPDPYYGNEQDFEHVFQLVFKACEDLSKKLK